LRLAAVALLAWRPLFRLAEANFWSLNALLVQPGYMICRELLRQIFRRAGQSPHPAGRKPGFWRIELLAGLLILAVSCAIIWSLWPSVRWIGAPADLLRPTRLVKPAIVNACIVVAAYAGAACLIWAVADAAMPEPVPSAADEPVPGSRVWRVALLSDVHVVGERYGFRIESGRAGPRGNERLQVVLARLAAIHAANPLDILLLAGDMTDAGRSAEWAEFLDALGRHPELRGISLMIPGNHDVSIIDRANPARLETPWANGRRLRRIRMLSAMDAIQGDRVRIYAGDRFGATLSERLASLRGAIRSAADGGTWRDGIAVDSAWRGAFPQILPPEAPDGLGVILLDSNADTHFSFTNAMGMLSAQQALRMEAGLRAWPDAGWIVVLHHHLTEYPHLSSAIAIRIGTALINGSWAIRQLSRHGSRIVAMHGHRHVDWRGRCGSVRIVSAPSVVMGASDSEHSSFMIEQLQVIDGLLRVLAPERVDIGSVRG
jgi:hypothetical protein